MEYYPVVLAAISYLSRSNLDVEVVSLVRNLEDLWPRETVDPQSIAVDEQSARTHAKHDLKVLRILKHQSSYKYQIFIQGGGTSWADLLPCPQWIKQKSPNQSFCIQMLLTSAEMIVKLKLTEGQKIHNQLLDECLLIPEMTITNNVEAQQSAFWWP